MSGKTHSEKLGKATRRAFLASAAVPLAASAASASSLADREVRGQDSLIEAARRFGAIVPEWTEAAQALVDASACPEAKARFDLVDHRHDSAKRHLLRLMRQSGCPMVVDRDACVVYLDASPSGSHEDLDGLMPEHSVVKIVPLKQVAGLG
ncbi:MAG TPA: hypothetical protein VFT74_06070 [Isosphaeraceae bacterium]|nr:hypothetical protein [Isosphaeraceae bacterium]